MTGLRIDPALTLEQLAHDQLAAALGLSSLRDAALAPGGSVAHRALGLARRDWHAAQAALAAARSKEGPAHEDYLVKIAAM